MKNILVMKASPSWWIKLGDFGQSKRAEGSNYHSVTGTRSYAAPEALETTNAESLDYTNAVDIWALGCIVYKLRTGRVLFPAAPYKRVIEERFKDGFYDFSKDSMKLSEAGTELLRLLLAVDPKKRPKAFVALQDQWLLNGILSKSTA